MSGENVSEGARERAAGETPAKGAAMETTVEDRIEVCVRTAAAGHMTLALPLDALPAFADEHLAAGRAVIAEYGDESLLIRVGREIVDFFKRLRGTGERRTERVTVTNPMRGGVDVAEAPDAPTHETTARVLSAALQARNGGGNFSGTDALGYAMVGPPPVRDYAPKGMPLNPEAEMRAWQGLVDKEGEAAALALTRDGAIPVRSTLWPGVVYLVKLGTVHVVRDGQIVSALCLQLADGGSVWDAVANRLSLLRAGEDGEVSVWATANAQSYR